MLHKALEKNPIIKFESFYGVYNFLTDLKSTDGDRRSVPIVVTIKNIKLIPNKVLNNLVHIFNKYRDQPYGLKLNLMIGV